MKLGRTRYVPPMVAHFPMGEVSWTKELLPEFLWLGLLNRHLGEHETARLLQEFVAGAGILPAMTWLALMSSYAAFDERSRASCRDALSAKRREQLSGSLEPLTAIFPEHPMAFLISPAATDASTSVPELRKAVSELHDRHGVPAIWMQTQAEYLLLEQRLISFASEAMVPDLNAISGYPRTEESQRAAAQIRAQLNGLSETFLGALPDRTWGTRFWNKCMSLGECSPWLT